MYLDLLPDVNVQSQAMCEINHIVYSIFVVISYQHYYQTDMGTVTTLEMNSPMCCIGRTLDMEDSNHKLFKSILCEGEKYPQYL